MITKSIDHPGAHVETEGILYVPLLQAALKLCTAHCVSVLSFSDRHAVTFFIFAAPLPTFSSCFDGKKL